MRAVRTGAISLALAGLLAAAVPASSSASICGAVSWVNGAAGKACGVVTNGDKLLGVGKKLATGHVGSAVKTVVGGGSGGGGSKAAALVGLAAIGTWVIGGAKTALSDTAKVLDKTTDPQLGTTWFSSTYWRMAGIAAVLTLPFLFAAAVQALLHSDLALLARAALGYLPLSLLAVGIAAPLTMLLLAACDEMSAIVSLAAGHSGVHFLSRLGVLTGGLVTLSHSPFLAFLVGLLTAAGAIALWIEMLMREAAVYIVVLMLPLAFAALAWPARRVWAVRATEMLVALILSKFAVIAVLALGGAALSQATGATGLMTGLVLVVLGAFAPWALVRLLPLAELASGAAGQLRGGLASARGAVIAADEGLGRAENWGGSVTAGMRRQVEAMSAGGFGASEHPDSRHEQIERPALTAGEEAIDGASHEAGRGVSHDPSHEESDEAVGPPYHDEGAGPPYHRRGRRPAVPRRGRRPAGPGAGTRADAGGSGLHRRRRRRATRPPDRLPRSQGAMAAVHRRRRGGRRTQADLGTQRRRNRAGSRRRSTARERRARATQYGR